MVASGGGASETTVPAIGSSSGTDVPLHEFVLVSLGSLDDRLSLAISELDRRVEQHFDLNDKALESALLSAKEAVAAALTAAKEAVDKAEAAASKRFEATNEFRGQLSDQANTFMPRLEAEQRLGQLRDLIDDVKGTRSEGVKAVWGYLVGALGVAVALVSILVPILSK